MEGQSEFRISSRLKAVECISKGKEILNRDGRVAFHAIGNSIVNAVKAANRLVELGYADMQKFNTFSIDETFENQPRKVYKVIIELSKSAEFDRINEAYEKSRAK